MVSVMLYPRMFCVALSMYRGCFVCCVSDSICELFGDAIRNMFGCGYYFIVECYGVV